jgi:hypothetical protein
VLNAWLGDEDAKRLSQASIGLALGEAGTNPGSKLRDREGLGQGVRCSPIEVGPNVVLVAKAGLLTPACLRVTIGRMRLALARDLYFHACMALHRL